MKNIGLFMIDSNTSEMDDYLVYLIMELKRCYVEELYITANNLSDKEWMKVKACFNNSAKAGINPADIKDRILGQETQRIILFDNSFFGPIFDPIHMFQSMENSQTDYWTVDSSEKPYMLVLNADRLKRKDAFFETFLKIANGDIKQVYTYLKDMKCSKGVYYSSHNTEGLDVGIELTYEAVTEGKCPFVRTDSFTYYAIDKSASENARDTYDYIHCQTNYDTSLIWDYLLKKYNVEQLKKALHLEYILSWKSREANPADEVLKDTAVIIHLHYNELVESCFNYIRNIPKEIDVYITAGNAETKSLITDQINKWELDNCRYIMKENRGRDISALLVACREVVKDYKYIGFLHDKNFHNGEVRTQAASFRYNLWENILKSDAYIRNVLTLFTDHPCLGLLSPPGPYNGIYLYSVGDSWCNNFQNTVDLAEKLKLRCDLDKNHSSLTLGTAFWCRTEALKPLFEYGFTYEDFMEEPMDIDGTISHAIERIFCYVAQSCGFYTAILMNTDYASLRGNSLQDLTKSFLMRYKRNVEAVNRIKEEIQDYCSRWPKIFLYGMGAYGRECLIYLIKHKIDLAGIIVSDGNRSTDEWFGYKVYELSEVECDNSHAAIILALGNKNIEEVTPFLSKAGWENILIWSAISKYVKLSYEGIVNNEDSNSWAWKIL